MPRESCLRLFTAISVPCPPQLARLLKELGQLGSAVKAMSPRELHCTLRFLGDTLPETAARLGPAIADALRDFPALTAELVGIGAFPAPQRPNVVWAGLQAVPFSALFERIAGIATDFGYEADRLPFKPHVTLARVKHRPPPKLAELMQQHAEVRWGLVEMTEIELFRSTLTPDGPRYDVLATAPLRRGA
jgi:2'-5' RNA ligase